MSYYTEVAAKRDACATLVCDRLVELADSGSPHDDPFVADFVAKYQLLRDEANRAMRVDK